MDLIKRRWLPFTLLLVVLLSVPTLVYFALGYKQALRDRVAKEVQSDISAITSPGGPLKIAYQVPPAGSREAIEYKFPPNELAITKFKTWRDQQQSELTKVVNAALEFNRGNRGVLLSGIFPEPAPADLAIKPLEFRRIYVERAHEELLRRLRAGAPLDPAALAQELKDRQADAVRVETGRENVEFSQLPTDIQAKITRAMLEYRVRRYGERAASLSFFCTPEAFRLPSSTGEAPTIADCFTWQWDYWVREDILSAIAAANAPRADLGVPGAIIKRVESLAIEPLTLAVVDPNNPGLAPYPPGSDRLVPIEPSASLTGRVSGPLSTNTFCDVRKVTLEVVAEARRLPAFIDALSATNFMTVLDCDLTQAKVADDLKEGYYYGPEPVVRARLLIETLWLREWMLPMVPKQLRMELLMPEIPAPEPAMNPDGTPATPASGGQG
ncbi:MAG: hypothetical protein AB7K52_09545 [Phycisphaerales bacterium]